MQPASYYSCYIGMEFRIRNARKEDADFIAEGILEAVGHEACDHMAAELPVGAGSVKDLFSKVASLEKSQYSYHNALIAEDEEGNRAGVIVAYDGAKLHELRVAFIDEYNRRCGTSYEESEMDDETDPSEIYIDTLCVRPAYRRNGLGGKLIASVAEKFKQSGKPLGLLVDHENPNAKSLYEKSGFSPIGPRRFLGIEMLHMQVLS